MLKRDIAYLIFFASHLPIIYLVDTVPLQPQWIQTSLSSQLRTFYVSTYRDKFFEPPTPAWFNAFIWMELIYHNTPLVPVHILIFGIQAFVTSLTCLVEVWAWEDRSSSEKWNITSLYGPYVALGAYMAIDMMIRLKSQLMPKRKRE
ncbi:uncharacterized protein N7469_009604 [Penicillium citrinum]|uniref:EXPERA domain-containing protein n=1 Tax=Penicillium citrinum TaxID=5077 RepID=A0A9W9NIT2_PENCI|nr:uncharacterized protein N7469_009604 [Penicillium citrinum]KAJ5220717.1 hypothetical protein N7469_009604 [Penicillium citrinum]